MKNLLEKEKERIEIMKNKVLIEEDKRLKKKE